MKKTTDNGSDSCKICDFFKKLIGITTVLAAITVAILKIIDAIKLKKSTSDNEGREYKEYYNFCGSRKYSLSEDKLAGIISKNILGATELNFADSSFKDDGFISVSGILSAVNIIVPDGVNIKLDGMFRNSAVDNDADDFDENNPTLYIVSKFSLCAVRISRQE